MDHYFKFITILFLPSALVLAARHVGPYFPTRDGTHTPELEGTVLITGPPGKVPRFVFL